MDENVRKSLDLVRGATQNEHIQRIIAACEEMAQEIELYLAQRAPKKPKRKRRITEQRRAYMRDLMRKRRAAEEADRKLGHLIAAQEPQQQRQDDQPADQ